MKKKMFMIRHLRRPPAYISFGKISAYYLTLTIETPSRAHTSRCPAKQFRDSSPSEQYPLGDDLSCGRRIHYIRGGVNSQVQKSGTWIHTSGVSLAMAVSRR